MELLNKMLVFSVYTSYSRMIFPFSLQSFCGGVKLISKHKSENLPRSCVSVFFTSHLWFDLRSPMMTSGEKKQRLKKKKAKTFIISKKKKKLQNMDILSWSLDVWGKCINNSGFSKARGLGCPCVALLRIIICSVSLLSIWEEKLVLWRNVAHTLLIEHERKGSSCQEIPHVRWNLFQQIWWQAFSESLEEGWNLLCLKKSFLFLAVLGLRCCAGFYSGCDEQGLLSSCGFSLRWPLLLPSTGSGARGLQQSWLPAREDRLRGCDPRP